MRTPALLFVFLLANPHAHPADPPAKPSAHLASLAKLYQAYDLPLLPPDAKVYRFTTVREDNPEGHKVWVEVGFELEPNEKGRPTKVLIGTREAFVSAGDSTTVEEVKPEGPKFEVVADHRDPLPFAAQCELHGWHDMAVAALDVWESRQGKNPNAQAALARAAWTYWTGEFQNHDADRAKVARRLQGLVNDNPELFGRPEQDLLRCLKLSLTVGEAKPGTIDARIDELIEVSGTSGQWSHPGSFECDKRVDDLVRIGFEAVPTLLAHFEDDRLTRSTTAMSWYVSSHPLLVRHFSRHVLCEFMADEYEGKPDELTKKQAEMWWTKAKKEGEEAYCLRQAVKVGFGPETPYMNPLRVVEVKYPHRLPDVFTALLKSEPTTLSLDPFVVALGRAKLPAAAKKRVLLDTLACKDWEWNGHALSGLHPLDAGEYHKRLISLLGELPADEDTAKREKLLDCAYTSVARAASLTADAKVWEAVGKYFNRAGFEVRRKWIDYLGWDADAAESRNRRTEFLVGVIEGGSAGRLTDAEARKERNRAAETLGYGLGVNPKPKPNWSEDDWKKFRAEVVKAAKKATKPEK